MSNELLCLEPTVPTVETSSSLSSAFGCLRVSRPRYTPSEPKAIKLYSALAGTISFQQVLTPSLDQILIRIMDVALLCATVDFKSRQGLSPMRSSDNASKLTRCIDESKAGSSTSQTVWRAVSCDDESCSRGTHFHSEARNQELIRCESKRRADLKSDAGARSLACDGADDNSASLSSPSRYQDFSAIEREQQGWAGED